MSSERENILKLIKDGKTRIAFLKDCIEIQEKAMKKGLPRDDVMPEYLEDLEELNELTSLNKTLLSCLSESEIDDKPPSKPFY